MELAADCRVLPHRTIEQRTVTGDCARLTWYWQSLYEQKTTAGRPGLELTAQQQRFGQVRIKHEMYTHHSDGEVVVDYVGRDVVHDARDRL